MPYILDTDWAINAMARRRRADTTLRRLAQAGVAVSLVTVGEIYEVAFNSPNPEAHLTSSRRFFRPFRILGLNDAIMERFAEMRAYLRRRGEIIPDFDLLIGATALQYGLTVLTYNLRHFSRIPDLGIYQPRQSSS